MLLAYAFYRKRPITKFSHPSQIPKFFIKEKLMQPGTVSKIEPTLSGPLLHVNHKPPVNLFFFSKKTLPIKVNIEHHYLKINLVVVLCRHQCLFLD